MNGALRYALRHNLCRALSSVSPVLLFQNKPGSKSPVYDQVRGITATMEKPAKPTKKGSPTSSVGSKQGRSSHALRSNIIGDEIKAEKEKFLNMKLTEKRRLYKCAEFQTLEDIQTWPEYFADMKKRSPSKSSGRRAKGAKYEVNEDLNNKVSMVRADITALEIDAIVNAANNSLLGGGGVDGAIHSAAGGMLKKECSTLKGCETGDAKITSGYRLPAKYVIHTVGPIGEQPQALESCYKKCLELMKKHELHTVAFPCISTGIYGYAVELATPVALKTIREWLEKESYAKEVQRVILCLFLKKDIEVYEDLMQVYFPLTKTEESDGAEKIDGATSEVSVDETKDSGASDRKQGQRGKIGALMDWFWHRKRSANKTQTRVSQTDGLELAAASAGPAAHPGSDVDKSDGEEGGDAQAPSEKKEDKGSSPAAKKRTPPGAD